MYKFKKVLMALFCVTIIIGVAVPAATFAATDPGLGEAETFSIIAQTAITGTATISGDVGINSTGAGITALTGPMVGELIYSTDGVAPGLAILDPAVQANLSSANDDISGQPLIDTIGPVLDAEIVVPGVYDIGAGRLNGGILTLDGPGIYIFRASSDFVSSGTVNLINGARACDVFWQVNTLATINGTEFVGTIIAGTGVHFGDGVDLDGRALALGGDVTLLNNTISGPTCEPIVAPAGSGSSSGYRRPRSVIVAPVVVVEPALVLAEETDPPVIVVAESTVPKLPNAGLVPDQKSVQWNIVIPVGIFMALILFLFVRRKQI